MSKYQYSTKTTYYQKARFFRESGTNKHAYCIEPFSFFNGNEKYQSIINPSYLTEYQINRIKNIAHFGYGYKNHTDEKWYAITQMMIWKESDPNSGRYYFTNGLNGNEITIFQDEINEINYLIQEYEKIPEILTKEIYLTENDKLYIELDNNNFYTDNELLIIHGNTIETNELEEGQYEFNLYKNDQYYNSPTIFYQAANSQDLIKTGDIDSIKTKLKVKVMKTKFEVIKEDYDNKSTIPQGDAELDGAIYSVLDENENEIAEIEIKNNKGEIENLKFGNYFLQEKKPGEGYTLDTTTCAFTIDKENTEISATMSNKVIKANIIIEKKYGEENNLNKEPNISFQIFNSKNELIDTITTNNEGIAKTVLPYGKYIIKQINTTEGYKKNDPFEINITDELEKKLTLNDLKIEKEIEIKVPNTHINVYKIIISKIVELAFIQIVCLRRYFL